MQLGPFALPLPPLLFALGVLIALAAGRRIAGGAQQAGQYETALLSTLLLALCAARASFAAMHWTQFSDAWLRIADIRDLGFEPVAGIAVAIACVAFYVVRSKPLRRPLVFGIAAGLASGALAFGIAARLAGPLPPLPAITLTTLDGRPAPLRASDGRPTILNVWATWCGPCRRELPVFEAAQRRHPDVRFVFANVGESRETVGTFLLSQQLRLDNTLLDRERQLEAALHIAGFPSTFTYDADGRSIASHFGEMSEATLADAIARVTHAGR
ncbi:Thioredoxin [Caballeronia glathei]|jgi:thiol-disulfide isomerase/thioredoxin|uniref:Thioredoxin domain-containing protein n=2 Tax=Caballeronia glathei TaxID=60547 RepID=A0A069PX08_9BURK|nr:hypothetical protein BG61_11760 [Caballeronia glathei]CDY74144.1 Thioredoxin [Caballeronia glathei]